MGEPGVAVDGWWATLPEYIGFAGVALVNEEDWSEFAVVSFSLNEAVGELTSIKPGRLPKKSPFF